MQFKALAPAAVCAVLLALPAWAHHSHGNYDLSKWTTLEGTARQVLFLVPHSIV